MTSNVQHIDQSLQSTWTHALASPGIEFPLQPLPILAGTIPAGLTGSLYRNGPGRLERGGRRMGHWFDGDGAILALHIAGGKAQGVYRYVQTAGYLAEQKADRLLYNNFGTRAPGLNGWIRGIKNAANTSVLALPDRLLALWEAGFPYALDLNDLHTLGPDDLGTGAVKMPYSAHPKVDPQTGDIYNFGLIFGKATVLELYRSDRTGRVVQQRSIPLADLPLIHDFALAGKYLVFCIAPVRGNLLPVLFKRRTFSGAMQWQPELGTQILLIDRETLEPLPPIQTDPWFQWHFGNGYETASGHVVVDIARYPDFQTNLFLQDVAQGRTERAVAGQLWRLEIDPQQGKVVSNTCVVDRGCEFPICVHPGQASSSTYLSVQKQGIDVQREVLGDIAYYDEATGQLTSTDLPAHLYVSEPIIADGWVLATVYDGQQHQSAVWIWEGQRLAEEPVCRIGLPEVVPMGFHGTWRSGTTQT